MSHHTCPTTASSDPYCLYRRTDKSKTLQRAIAELEAKNEDSDFDPWKILWARPTALPPPPCRQAAHRFYGACRRVHKSPRGGHQQPATNCRSRCDLST